jgi:membrane protein
MASKGESSAVFSLLKEAASSWMAHKAPRMGAALAYYTAFSLAPLVILILSVISLVMERHAAAQDLVAQISDLVGAEGGSVVQGILDHAGSTEALSWSTAVSLVVLWISASGAFGELQDSLNTIWEVPEQKHAWWAMLRQRMLSLSMVFVLGFFLVASLVVSTVITGLTSAFVGPGSKIALEVGNSAFSLVIIAALFGFVFRYLPDAKLRWRDVMPGAIFSAALFILGKFCLALYISHSAFASSYGAAASFVVILFWVFYSAQILYFGAEFTRAYTRRFGSHQDSLDAPPLKTRVKETAVA